MAKGKALKSKKEPLVVMPKPNNPARKFMSKADAVAENRKEKERSAKLDDYKKQLEAEDGVQAPTEPKKRGRKKSEE